MYLKYKLVSLKISKFKIQLPSVSSGIFTPFLLFLISVNGSIYLCQNNRNYENLFLCICIFFFETVLLLLPRLECSGTVHHCNFCLQDSNSSPASVSWGAGITGTHQEAQLIFVFLVEMGFHHVGQTGIELLTSGDLPALASQSAGITGVSHPARPRNAFKIPLFIVFLMQPFTKASIFVPLYVNLLCFLSSYSVAMIWGWLILI